MQTIEDYKKEKEILENNILKLVNEFEKKYNTYVYEINILHDGSRTYDGHTNFRTEFIGIKDNFND